MGKLVQILKANAIRPKRSSAWTITVKKYARKLFKLYLIFLEALAILFFIR